MPVIEDGGFPELERIDGGKQQLLFFSTMVPSLCVNLQ